MVARLARLVLRAIGWCLTPLVIIFSAAVAATVAALLAPRLSVRAGLIAMALAGLLGAVVGSWAWLQLLRHSRELREALHVTPAGVPTSAAMDETIGPDDQPTAGGAA